METPCFDSLTLLHDPAQRLLYHQWRGELNMHCFRPAVKYVLDWLRRYAVEAWVIDFNGLPNISPVDQIWLATKVLPAAHQLPSLRRVGVVLSDSRFNQMVAEELLENEAPDARPFDVQLFADAATALEWAHEGTPALLLPAQRCAA